MTQVVLINGPPQSGKDTIARLLVPYLKFRHMKFAAPLKAATAGLLDMNPSAIEDFKEKPTLLLRNDTIRQHLIKYFDFLAREYGDEVLARMLWHRMRNSALQLFLVTDSGKEVETRYIIKSIGAANCLILRVHRDGCDFKNDNREYLPDGMCQTFDLHNDSTREKLAMFALRCIVIKFKPKLLLEPTWEPA